MRLPCLHQRLSRPKKDGKGFRVFPGHGMARGGELQLLLRPRQKQGEGLQGEKVAQRGSGVGCDDPPRAGEAQEAEGKKGRKIHAWPPVEPPLVLLLGTFGSGSIMPFWGSAIDFVDHLSFLDQAPAIYIESRAIRLGLIRFMRGIRGPPWANRIFLNNLEW